MSQLTTTHSVSRTLARDGIERAILRAVEMECRICIAIVDPAGHLVSYDRMDGAPFQSARHAQDKAVSSAGNGVATHEMWAYVQDDPQLSQGVLKVDGLSVLGGGLPITHGEELIGAVGVSGSCGMTEDQEIAKTAVAAVLDGVSASHGSPGAD